jgi:hypothetical protein
MQKCGWNRSRLPPHVGSPGLTLGFLVINFGYLIIFSLHRLFKKIVTRSCRVTILTLFLKM